MKHGINANVVRRWIPLYRNPLAVALPAFIPLKVEPKRKTEALAIIELPLGQQMLTVKWPTSDPEGCARFIWTRSMIRIDSIWLATDPMTCVPVITQDVMRGRIRRTRLPDSSIKDDGVRVFLSGRYHP